MQAEVCTATLLLFSVGLARARPCFSDVSLLTVGRGLLLGTSTSDAVSGPRERLGGLGLGGPRGTRGGSGIARFLPNAALQTTSCRGRAAAGPDGCVGPQGLCLEGESPVRPKAVGTGLAGRTGGGPFSCPLLRVPPVAGQSGLVCPGFVGNLAGLQEDQALPLSHLRPPHLCSAV